MQVDKMFSAEAAITIGQTKHKRREGYLYNGKGDRALSYNGAQAAPTHKHFFKSSARYGRAKGGKKKRNCGRADGERRKKMNI